MKKICASCHFWSIFSRKDMPFFSTDQNSYADCTRNAPTAKDVSGLERRCYPKTLPEDTCGQWQMVGNLSDLPISILLDKKIEYPFGGPSISQILEENEKLKERLSKHARGELKWVKGIDGYFFEESVGE